jgi:hypothetical protein
LDDVQSNVCIHHSQPSIGSVTAVCRQKPQKENSAGKFGWGTIQPLLKVKVKAGAGLIDCCCGVDG